MRCLERGSWRAQGVRGVVIVLLPLATLLMGCEEERGGSGLDGPQPGPFVGALSSQAARCGEADLSGLQTAVHVSSQGTDSPSCGPSTATACQTIQQGITNCGAAGCGVLVRHGLYVTGATIRLRDAVSVYGSCRFDGEPDRQYRTVVQAFPAAGTPAISATDIHTPTTVYGLVVIGKDETASGMASLGMTVSGSTGLTLSHMVLVSGKGGDGAPGPSPGQAGSGQTGGSVSSGAFVAGGQGRGGLACHGENTAGHGGDGADWQQNSLSGCFIFQCTCNWSGGSAGTEGGPSGTVGGGSGGGSGGHGGFCRGHSGFPGQGGQGDAGLSGECSTQPGRADSNVWGSFTGVRWVPSSGGPGGTGNVGSGGGGGGAGGVCITYDNSGVHFIPYWGQPGGGGGGGGCGGDGGGGGGQGGASIPLVLFNASVTGSPEQNSLIPGRGVRGGDGGHGGPGGPGGPGGSGGAFENCTVYDANAGIGWAGQGGPGNAGGPGGAGSGGAGGNGGPSLGIALVGTSPRPGNNNGIYQGQPGIAGSKGQGGQGGHENCGGAFGQDGMHGGTEGMHKFN